MNRRAFLCEMAALVIPPSSASAATDAFKVVAQSGWALGQRPFTASSPWNKPVPSTAKFTKLAWEANTGYNYSLNRDSYSPGIYFTNPSYPACKITYPAGWGYPGGTITLNLQAGVSGASGTDGEILIVDQSNNVHNFWQFNRTSNTTATASSYGVSNATTGTGWGSSSPFLGAGITAAGSNELGGLLVQAETDTGVINHALALSVDMPMCKPGFVAPAIAGDGSSSSGIVQQGEWLAIPPGTTMPSGLQPLAQVMFTAMQKYGCYVVDVAGGVSGFRFQANAYDNTTLTNLRPQMASIITLLQKVN